MTKAKSLRTSILKMILSTILIVFVCFVAGKLSLLDFKPPKFVRVSSVGQELSDSVRQRVLDKELYFPYAIEEGDSVAFTDLIQYNKQIYVATGYLLHDGSKFPWFVTLKRLPVFNYYMYEEDTIYIFDNLNFMSNHDALWSGRTDVWYFTNLDIYVSPNDLQIKGETHVDFGRILLFLVIIGGFYAGRWSAYKKKRENAE